METFRNPNNKINLEKFILYDKKKKIAKCLVPECQVIFTEENELSFKRHYHLFHNINIANSKNMNKDKDSNFIEDLDNDRSIKEYPDNYLKESLDDKGCKGFRVADYVEYFKETNISKCLIKNCERLMSDRRTGNIKRHYQRVHDFVIVHGSSRSYKDNEEDDNDISEQRSPIIVNLDKYFEYDSATNKSICKVPGCNASLIGKKPNNIMRHYNLIHNYRIESNENSDWNKSSISNIDSDDGFLNTSAVPVENLVAYNIDTSSYQCLFLNCNQSLELDLTAIQKHYYKIHNIIITKDAGNIPDRFLRKRKFRYIHEVSNKNDELSAKGEDEILSNSENPDFITTGTLEIKERKKFSAKNYVEFCESTNISKCLIKNCKRLMSGLMSSNIKRHYRRMHNMIIIHGLSNIILANNEKETTQTIDANDFLSYDIKSSSYQCLFPYCNCTLELDVNIIKAHYNKIHNIIIVETVGNKPRGIKQGMYFAVSRQIPEHMNETQVGIKKINYDKPHCSQTLQKRRNFLEKSKEKRTKYTNYVEYNREANVTKCLIKNCQILIMGRIVKNIKTHYRTLHKMNINISFRDNTFDDELEGEEVINISDFVVYDIETCSYQCLFKKCHQTLKKNVSNIREHYSGIHNTIIGTGSDYIILRRRRYNELHGLNDDSYLIRNESLSDEETCSLYSETTDNILTDNVDGKPYCSKTLNRQHCNNLILDNYIEYNEHNGKSKCLIKHCQKLFSDRIEYDIKKHYKRFHNLKIGIGDNIPLEEDAVISDETAEQAYAKISDLVVYDKETLSYRCSFIKCNKNMKKHLPTIKKHFFQTHKAIIIMSFDCVGGKRRRYNESSDSTESDKSDNYSYTIRNELLSDEEQLSECSKKFDKNETGNYSTTIKQELISDEEHQLTSVLSLPKLTEKACSIKISTTKQAFFKLCLGLIIERDLSLSLFDDVYFKQLLLPYEHLYNCDINSGLMLNLMCKANDIIVGVLKKKLTNKIICLELIAVSQEKKYFLILNLRFLENDLVCNQLIGFLPIANKGMGVLPIYEFLSRFNIEKQQLYVTTIAAAWEHDEEIYKICNDICKHNPCIKKHPIWYIQTILKNFIKNYAADVKSWQELVNYDCRANTDVSNNLIEFSNYIEKFSETNIDLRTQLKEANLFLKIFKILRNFIEKLKEEQYVAGDLYRDWLCCELELKGDLKEINNIYAGKLYEDLTECKNTLLQCDEFLSALYLDARFNFLGSRLLTDCQKAKGKQHLCSIWEKFNNYLHSVNSSESVDPLLTHVNSNDGPNDDDEYALLNQHINDIMPVKSNVLIEDIITNCVPTKREPFGLDILKYWYCKQDSMKDINELTKIAFAFSSSQYVLLNMKTNFAPALTETDKYDKFLIENNHSILEKNFDLLLKNLN